MFANNLVLLVFGVLMPPTGWAQQTESEFNKVYNATISRCDRFHQCIRSRNCVFPS